MARNVKMHLVSRKASTAGKLYLPQFEPTDKITFNRDTPAQINVGDDVEVIQRLLANTEGFVIQLVWHNGIEPAISLLRDYADRFAILVTFDERVEAVSEGSRQTMREFCLTIVKDTVVVKTVT